MDDAGKGAFFVEKLFQCGPVTYVDDVIAGFGARNPCDAVGQIRRRLERLSADTTV